MKTIKTIAVLLLGLSTLSVAQTGITSTTLTSPVNRNGLDYERVIKIVTPGSDAVLDNQGNVVTPAKPATTTVVETGRIAGVRVDAGTNPSIAIPHTRKIKVLSVTEEEDLEMIVNLAILYYKPDGITPMLDAINADATLSEDAKAYQRQLFATYTMTPKRTRGSFVDPSTGAVLKNATSGLSESQFYQALTIASLNAMGLSVSASTPIQTMRYLMLVVQAKAIATREGLL